MLFNLSKVFVALAAVAAATALPANPPLNETVSCDFVLRPEVPVDASTTNLQAEFNYAIGRALIVVVPSKETFSEDATWVDNGNTFAVKEKIAAIGLHKAQTAAIMNGWVGTTLMSLTTNWFVNSVACA